MLSDGGGGTPVPPAAGNTGGVAKGDPINIATGNVYEGVTDYTTMGTNPLALTRQL